MRIIFKLHTLCKSMRSAGRRAGLNHKCLTHLKVLPTHVVARQTTNTHVLIVIRHSLAFLGNKQKLDDYLHCRLAFHAPTLKRLDGQQTLWSSCLKLWNIIFLAIHNYKVKKKSKDFIFQMLTFFYTVSWHRTLRLKEINIV